MSKNDGVNLFGRDRQATPVALAPFFLPWKSPQSTSTCKPARTGKVCEVLMRCLEPVTVPAAPRN